MTTLTLPQSRRRIDASTEGELWPSFPLKSWSSTTVLATESAAFLADRCASVSNTSTFDRVCYAVRVVQMASTGYGRITNEKRARNEIVPTNV